MWVYKLGQIWPEMALACDWCLGIYKDPWPRDRHDLTYEILSMKVDEGYKQSFCLENKWKRF